MSEETWVPVEDSKREQSKGPVLAPEELGMEELVRVSYRKNNGNQARGRAYGININLTSGKLATPPLLARTVAKIQVFTLQVSRECRLGQHPQGGGHKRVGGLRP